jgi:hypothetical protein
MEVYYTHCIPATCFGQSRGHLQRVELQITEVFRDNAQI